MIWTRALAEPPKAWSTETEDLDATLVAWEEGKGVSAHVNNEVDVVMVVLAGQGMVQVGPDQLSLEPGTVVVIPKAQERQVRATGGRLTYLNVHKRRRKLMPSAAGVGS